MSDLTLECSDCQLPFEFTEGEQEFFNSKGLNAPKRCKDCRVTNKKARLMSRVPGEQHEYTCGDCSAPVTLNFKTERIVWCRACFANHKK